jgi:hypothetical protein
MDGRSNGADALTDQPEPAPLATRHVTSSLLCHVVNEHAVAPVRTRRLRSDWPKLLPNTEMTVCAVDGSAAGDALVTKFITDDLPLERFCRCV